MSFIGAIAAPVRQVIAARAARIQHPCLIVGAGNFTVPSALRSGGYTGSISACDIALYTTVLGGYLTNQKPPMTEQPDCPHHLKGLVCYDTPLTLAASVSLLYDMREIWQLKNPYQQRQFDQIKHHWSQLLDDTMARLERFAQHIGPIDYQPRDGFDFLTDRDPAHTVFAFPPTYKSGYERLEKLLRAAIAWQPPPYREMTDQSLDLYHTIARFESYIVVLEKDLPDVYDILGPPAATLPRGRGRHTHILAKPAPRPKIIVKKHAQSAPAGPYLDPGAPVTGRETITMAKLTAGQSTRLNELYLSTRIDYAAGGAGACIGFFLDGRLLGKADFTPSAHPWKLSPGRPQIYIMSDLVVSHPTPKLAKLVLLCALSRDVKELLDLKYIEDFGWAVTTAFSRHAASMKYRGIFKLHTRKPTDHGYMLNYYAPFGNHSLADAPGIWKQRYGKTAP